MLSKLQERARDIMTSFCATTRLLNAQAQYVNAIPDPKTPPMHNNTQRTPPPSGLTVYRYCSSYLAILSCVPFLALPNPLPLLLLMPSNFAFNCSWILRF
jgi:hypothetical protein